MPSAPFRVLIIFDRTKGDWLDEKNKDTDNKPKSKKITEPLREGKLDIHEAIENQSLNISPNANIGLA
jgi:hypothetical protein